MRPQTLNKGQRTMRRNVILPISKGRGVLNYVPAMVHTPADNAPGDSDKDTLHSDLTWLSLS